MLRSVLALIVTLAACSKGTAPGTVDAASKDASGVEITPAYHHTISIDGLDDFVAAEQLPTTSAGYDARISWDEQNLYIGYSGADLDPAVVDAATKWLFVYVDVDPGTANGAATSETYNTQGAAFPTGFRPDYYVRWKADATLLTLKKLDAAAWVDDPAVPPAARGGNFVEIAVPRAVLGGGTAMQVVTWMINEKNGAEGSYAGLYSDNFTDGYFAALPLSKVLKIDFTATRDPNDAANQGP